MLYSAMGGLLQKLFQKITLFHWSEIILRDGKMLNIWLDLMLQGLSYRMYINSAKCRLNFASSPTDTTQLLIFCHIFESKILYFFLTKEQYLLPNDKISKHFGGRFCLRFCLLWCIAKKANSPFYLQTTLLLL